VVPSLYMLGIITDFLGTVLLSIQKHSIEDKLYEKHKLDKQAVRMLPAKLLVYSSGLAEGYNVRSSRDRIARGMLVNALLATIVFTVLFLTSSQVTAGLVVLSIGIGTTLFFWAMWRRYQYLTTSYEVRAWHVLHEYLEREERLKKQGDNQPNPKA
jgi:hypothetical protein